MHFASRKARSADLRLVCNDNNVRLNEYNQCKVMFRASWLVCTLLVPLADIPTKRTKKRQQQK